MTDPTLQQLFRDANGERGGVISKMDKAIRTLYDIGAKGHAETAAIVELFRTKLAEKIDPSGHHRSVTARGVGVIGEKSPLYAETCLNIAESVIDDATYHVQMQACYSVGKIGKGNSDLRERARRILQAKIDRNDAAKKHALKAIAEIPDSAEVGTGGSRKGSVRCSVQ